MLINNNTAPMNKNPVNNVALMNFSLPIMFFLIGYTIIDWLIE